MLVVASALRNRDGAWGGNVGVGMAVRGDRERDLAVVEREWAFEMNRRAQAAHDLTRRRFELLAQLHREAADTLERLAGLYDEIDALK